jgi:hypothetical protein
MHQHLLLRRLLSPSQHVAAYNNPHALHPFCQYPQGRTNYKGATEAGI